MFSAESIKQFLLATVVPIVAGAVSAWLTGVHVLNIFNVTGEQIMQGVTSALVFGIVTLISWLKIHHILKGTYGSK